MSQINSDLIDPIEDLILSPSEFLNWVKENSEGEKEFISDPITVLDRSGNEVENLPGRWKVVDIFQSGRVMYRRY